MSERTGGGDRPERGAVPPPLRAAVVDLLSEEPYGVARRYRIAVIAERAGMTKTELRRWPSRAELVIAVYAEFVSELPAPDTGDVRDDLVAYTRGMLRLMRGPAGGLMNHVLGELHAQAELRDAYVVADDLINAQVLRILHRARIRGQVNEDADLGLVTTLAKRWWVARLASGREPMDDAQADRLVDGALMRVLRCRWH